MLKRVFKLIIASTFLSVGLAAFINSLLLVHLSRNAEGVKMLGIGIILISASSDPFNAAWMGLPFTGSFLVEDKKKSYWVICAMIVGVCLLIGGYLFRLVGYPE